VFSGKIFVSFYKTLLIAPQASFLSFLLEKGKDFVISEAVRVRESLLTTSVESSNIDFRYPLKKFSKNFCSYSKFPLF
jgi:hypothetical protein